jgi:cytochrome c biogenesis protein
MIWKALVAHFGSTRSTLVLLSLMAAVVLARPTYWPLALLIGLLALNLLVAVLLHPAFRRQGPLLVAHLALLALVVAVAVGRLTALDGRFELTQGEAFDGTLLDRAAGALHVDRLQRLSFRQEGFEIDYAPGRQRGATRNTVTWQGEDGRPQRGVIGDHHPLVLDSHRFYTSPNKGFAPLLRWEPAKGEPLRGAVHLPSYPMHELRQSRSWTLPDGREAWVMLQIDETLIAPEAAAHFRLPQRYRLIVRVDELRAELQPGDALALPGGRLVFEELRTWMGYRVAYDPALPWLLASSLLAALAMAVHYALRIWPRSQSAGLPRAGLVDG